MIHNQINEALTILKLDKEELAKKLWPNATDRQRYQNMRHLLNGKTKNYNLEMIRIICDYLKVDADYLFK
jgi:hypothetical protein